MAVAGDIRKLVKSRFPAPAARAIKWAGLWPSYWAQMHACRRAFERFGDRYDQNVLFVAGLPKSGTTWLERMIAEIPGFGTQVRIPEAGLHELRTGGSHDFELPERVFDRFDRRLAVMKLHCHGSAHNVETLRKAGVRCVIIYRDLRDVAVSNYYYVRRARWHPEHALYRDEDVATGLRRFADRTLGRYIDWIRSWRANRDPATSLEIRYEQVLAEPVASMRKIVELFDLGVADETIASLVEAHSFERSSGGRQAGEADASSFLRKGVAGDWKNQFDDETKEMYKERLGGFLVEIGYERDESW